MPTRRIWYYNNIFLLYRTIYVLNYYSVLILIHNDRSPISLDRTGGNSGHKVVEAIFTVHILCVYRMYAHCNLHVHSFDCCTITTTRMIESVSRWFVEMYTKSQRHASSCSGFPHRSTTWIFLPNHAIFLNFFTYTSISHYQLLFSTTYLLIVMSVLLLLMKMCFMFTGSPKHDAKVKPTPR